MNALVRVYAYACVCTIEQPTLGVTRSLAEQVAAMQEVIDQGHYPQDSRIAAHTRRVRRIVDSLTTRIHRMLADDHENDEPMDYDDDDDDDDDAEDSESSSAESD